MTTDPVPGPTPSPDRRSLLRHGATGLLLAGLAGCARIPTSTDIDVRELGEGSGGDAPFVRALPPADGASAAEVVRGFVQAGVGPEADYSVAREHLTEAAAEEWDPLAAVTIYSGSQELDARETAPGTVVLAVQAVASVDAAGIRSDLSMPATREITVGLVQVAEQWRIDSVPDGIFLSEAAFGTLFAPGRLYFVDARARHLVPDHRWFPLQDGAPGVLARLDAGPSAVLDAAVTTRVPAAAGIAEATVSTAADGVVQVTVPAAVGALPAAERSLALSQMEASLRSVRTLEDLRLIWDGADLTPTDEVRLDRAPFGHRPFAAGERGIIALGDATTGGAVTQLVPEFEDTAVRAPAIAQDGVLAAALTPGRDAVLLASTDGSVARREATVGGSLPAPRIDDAGYVWTATPEDDQVLVALGGRDAADDARVDAPWLAGREVLSLDIAADSTRLLLLTTDDDGARLDLCAVVRDETGAPRSLTEPRVIRIPQMTAVRTASWYDEVAVLVLGTDTAADEERAQVVDLETGRDLLPAFQAAVETVAGTSIAESIWAGTAGGGLLRSDGERWVEVDLAARDPGLY